MYAVMRLGKLKSLGAVAATGQHNERERRTPNADPDRRAENIRLAGSGDLLVDVQARLEDAPPKRKDVIIAIEHVMTASRPFFEEADHATVDRWVERSMEWLRDTYGRDNIVAATFHLDELAPHLHAIVVPVTDDGRLNGHHFIGGSRGRLSELQDSYHAAVTDCGLQRGVRGSIADHQTVQEWYAKIQEPTPEHVREHLEVDRPGRIVTNPERWASEQQERIAERLAPVVDAALTKATHYEQQAAKAEANIVVLQGQVREIARERDTLREDYKALAAQVRAIDLPTVIERLGGQVDRYDAHKYRLDGEHISITDARFFNHDRQQGGGGAIDLVMHAAGYDYREAVAYLRDTHGAEAALTAATWHGARQAHDDAQQIVEHAERPAFRAPTPDEGRWSQVRNYLVEQRQLPATLVDDLHNRGTIYADSRSNAVFIRQDADGLAVGASLRGTAPGSEFKGLALGSRREEGHFAFTVGQPAPYMAVQYHIVESPIDALSRAALIQHEGVRGEYHFVSTDGHGEIPRRHIDEGLAARGLVHCGFDNDKGGATLWERVQEAYPRAEALVRERPPSGAKDWNDALRTAHTHVQAQDRDDERAPSRGKGTRGQEREGHSH